MSEVHYLFFDSVLDPHTGEMRFTRHEDRPIVYNGSVPNPPVLPSFEPWASDPTLTVFYDPTPDVWEPQEVRHAPETR